MRLLIAVCLLAIIGCVPGVKRGEDVMAGASTNIFSFLPGYKNRRIRRLDFMIEVKEKELRLEELRVETKKARKAYSKIE